MLWGKVARIAIAGVSGFFSAHKKAPYGSARLGQREQVGATLVCAGLCAAAAEREGCGAGGENGGGYWFGNDGGYAELKSGIGFGEAGIDK